MLQALNLPPKFAVALDPEFIRATIERASRLQLTRRTCRPLETRPSRNVEIELSDFDSQIDAETIFDEEPTGDDAFAVAAVGGNGDFED